MSDESLDLNHVNMETTAHLLHAQSGRIRALLSSNIKDAAKIPLVEDEALKPNAVALTLGLCKRLNFVESHFTDDILSHDISCDVSERVHDAVWTVLLLDRLMDYFVRPVERFHAAAGKEKLSVSVPRSVYDRWLSNPRIVLPSLPAQWFQTIKGCLAYQTHAKISINHIDNDVLTSLSQHSKQATINKKLHDMLISVALGAKFMSECDGSADEEHWE